jgi:hypothetical protein
MLLIGSDVEKFAVYIMDCGTAVLPKITDCKIIARYFHKICDFLDSVTALFRTNNNGPALCYLLEVM